jgi:hypothetical protein
MGCLLHWKAGRLEELQEKIGSKENGKYFTSVDSCL